MNSLSIFEVSLSWKHRDGITVKVFARSEEEAEIMALNSPEASDYLSQNPSSTPLLSCTNYQGVAQ